MTPRERAEALFRLLDRHRSLSDDEYVALIAMAITEHVRALLENMEEPSDEMIDAAASFFPRVEPRDRYAVIGDCWRAMLAALRRKAVGE